MIQEECAPSELLLQQQQQQQNSTTFLMDSMTRVLKMYSSHLTPLTSQLTDSSELEKIYRDLTIANTSIFNIAELLSRNAVDIEACAQDTTTWPELNNYTKSQILKAYRNPASRQDSRVYTMLTNFIDRECPKMPFIKAMEMIIDQRNEIVRAGASSKQFSNFLERFESHYVIAHLDEQLYQNQTVREYLFATMNMFYESTNRLRQVGSRHYASAQNVLLPLIAKFFNNFEDGALSA